MIMTGPLMKRMDSTGGDERGAALMIVLIALVGLTALGVAGLTMTTSDIRHSENVEASTEAFYAADAGLHQYLGSSANGTAADTFTVGSSTVIATPTLVSNLSGGQPMYRVRSEATHTVAGVATTRAVNALGIFVPASGGGVNVNAALASGAGMLKNGGSGTISGVDQASAGDPQCPDSPGSTVAGLSVPPGGYIQSGGESVPDGDPDIDESAADGEELLEGTGIDWAGLSEGDKATYTVPPDDWPDYDAIPADEWPVVYVDGNLAVDPNHSGRGTIIVTGNLEMQGSFEWDGVLLVGGYMTSNGYQTIEGAVVTGLNILLGESDASSDIGNGNKKFLYNSCWLKKASEAWDGSTTAGLALVPGSWSEEI
jgi:Tfp pilus assembly protein PilX